MYSYDIFMTEGKHDGQGTYTWPDGSSYVGGFQDHNYHGLF